MNWPELWVQLPTLMIVTSFVLVTIAVVSILLAKGLSLQDRLLWLLVVTVFNIVGVVVWIVYSRRRLDQNAEQSHDNSD